MKDHKVVQDVIKDVPKNILCVRYSGNRLADMGNLFTPAQTSQKPEVGWKFTPMTYYTLAMVDPDVPSRAKPHLREFLHWLVINILQNRLESGDEHVGYIGPRQGKEGGLHRYVFLLYEQQERIKVDCPKKMSCKEMAGREKFCIRDFAEKYKMCEPKAGNFFQAESAC